MVQKKVSAGLDVPLPRGKPTAPPKIKAKPRWGELPQPSHKPVPPLAETELHTSIRAYPPPNVAAPELTALQPAPLIEMRALDENPPLSPKEGENRLALLEKLQEGAAENWRRGKKTLRNVIADRHRYVDKDGSFLIGEVLRGSLRGILRGQVGLPDTPSHQALVASFPRRAAYEKEHPDRVWVQTSAELQGRLGVMDQTFAQLNPVSFNVTALVGHRIYLEATAARALNALDDLIPEAAAQVKAMLPTVNPEEMERQASGSTWKLITADSSLGVISARAGESKTVGPVSVYASASMGVRNRIGLVRTTEVQKLDDGLVHYYTDTYFSNEDSLYATARVGFRADNLKGVAKVVAKRMRLVGAVIPTFRSTADVLTGDQGVGVSASVVKEHGQLQAASAVLDLKTEKGRQTYRQLITASPTRAAELIDQLSLGTNYDGTRQAQTKGIFVGFFGEPLFQKETSTKSFFGRLWGAEGEATLHQTDIVYRDKSWFSDEQRTISARAGRVVRDGTEEEGFSLELDVRNDDQEAKLTLERFANAMRLDWPELQRAQVKGRYEIQLAMTNDNIDRLFKAPGDQLEAKLFEFYGTLAPDGAPPFVGEHRQEFESYKRSYQEHFYFLPELKERAKADYAKRFPGRVLERDLDAEKRLAKLGERLWLLRGTPDLVRNVLVKTLIKEDVPTTLALMVTLHELAGADLSDFTVSLKNGNSIAPPGLAKRMTMPSTMLDERLGAP